MPSPVPAAPLMLSVSGARGIVGESMTPAVATDFAAAFGSFIRCDRRAGSQTDAPIIVLGRDSRPSGAALAPAAVAGLASVGCSVIDLGIVSTPTVSVMVAQRQAAGGMVVTASHNPGEWNGLKCLTADGAAPPPREVAMIVDRYHRRRFAMVDAASIRPTGFDDSGCRVHVDRVLAQVEVGPIRRAGFTVVLDSVNGAGGRAGRMLLDELGCRLVHLNAEPTGCFAHPPEPLEKNLEELARTTAAERADLGFAQDPDADRLAIIDETGRYIGEEYTLVLAARRVLDLRGGGAIAANLSTSRMIDDLAARYPGTRVLRTPVGEAHIVEAMRPAGAIIGGEGNGGVVLPGVCWVRDSFSAMALVLDLLAARPSRRVPLSAIIAALPRYTMIKHSFDLQELGGREALAPAIEKVTRAFADRSPITFDGVRIDFTDGWVHFRGSNTEPIVRLIAEATSRERAWELIDEVAVAAGIR